mmetsp:Transcript_64587/g.129884  ORF Transcript_64587/g.129884 Transcript_64587/m.129884 type:complete len:234 (+) Transcript_64587:411-1112(+)
MNVLRAFLCSTHRCVDPTSDHTRLTEDPNTVPRLPLGAPRKRGQAASSSFPAQLTLRLLRQVFSPVRMFVRRACKSRMASVGLTPLYSKSRHSQAARQTLPRPSVPSRGIARNRLNISCAAAPPTPPSALLQAFFFPFVSPSILCRLSSPSRLLPLSLLSAIKASNRARITSRVIIFVPPPPPPPPTPLFLPILLPLLAELQRGASTCIKIMHSGTSPHTTARNQADHPRRLR